jgi:hypothetical protein
MSAVNPSFPTFMEVGLEILNMLLATVHWITPGVGQRAERRSMVLGEGITRVTEESSQRRLKSLAMRNTNA